MTMSADDEGDLPSGLPDVFEVRGASPGPTVAVLGGVHGDELEGVLAARRVARLLDPAGLRGTVRFAAPAHPAAWSAIRRTSPLDGLNLARVFPGDPLGNPTERVAAVLTSQLITGADLLIDLHSAGEGFDMPLLVGYGADAGDVSERSAAAAEAFAAPFLWEHPTTAPGRSLSAATTLGIPSIYVEGRGGGQVRHADLTCYVGGVLRVLRHLGMIDEAPAPAQPAPVRVHGDGDTDGGIEAGAAGYFVTAVEVGDSVSGGALLGALLDEHGEQVADARSPHDGVVMLLRRHSRTEVGDTLAIVATVTAPPGEDPR
ncbi:hypothetical protein HC031_24990 [Planosporangium thailandense]|uniref:Succinylglutamate desuccinylase/Aspartoacylase catalytic domain-containing protein n=1 Tax=Planosporangium thailandense TaxID=765197 RepID=A0ABX0Y4J8_9ACTN|nr:succinylglutamate desuccinylase/aspartoacylase family protein [Planosporangium thailandense]NJC72948.1 hypothetical protein [Planosporangium thailandense]